MTSIWRVAFFVLPFGGILAACSGASGSAIASKCNCPALDTPVCGVDGITYENNCNAQCAGVQVARAGHCGSDATTCSCPSSSDPVCGANGITYENACSATCAHQSITRAGVCSTGLDGGGGGDDEDASVSSDGGSGSGSCTSVSCQKNQVCVDDGCAGSGCTYPGEGNTCPTGYTYEEHGACGPVGPPPGGVCFKGCTSLETTHHCVNVPSSCAPASCACLPSDICAGVSASCSYIANGIVQCVAAAQAGASSF